MNISQVKESPQQKKKKKKKVLVYEKTNEKLPGIFALQKI